MNREIRLAIHGGKPIRKNYLPYGRQWIDEDDIKTVIEALQGEYITTGPRIEKFEKELANYVGANYAVAFSNGTAALHAACFAADIKEGNEVITTPLTFVATANSIIYQGGRPVFCDINPQTYNIDPEGIEDLITEETKVIIPVDFAGLPVDMDKIRKIANENKLIVIEDAAHALGSVYKGKKVGSLSDMTMFSFHPVKHITTGEGGVITTNNEKLYHKLMKFRSHGITKKQSELLEDHGPWYYEMQILGYNYRITDIQMALGISQLNKIDTFLKIRKDYVKVYNDAFKNMDELVCPVEPYDVFSSWHLYIIRLKLEKLSVGRREVFEALLKENIGVNVHYIPVYYHPYYQNMGYSKGLCKNTEKLYEEIITLPLFPAMSREDLNDVINAVEKVINFYRID